MLVNRRRFLTGLIAAPVIIRAASLMPVKAIDPDWSLYETDFATPPVLYRARSGILRSEDFRLIVEPILDEAFANYYPDRAALWREVFPHDA